MWAGPHPDTDNIMDPKPSEGEEQAKKRRGRKKSKLEDMFPAYLQVGSLTMPMSKTVFKHKVSSGVCLCFSHIKFKNSFQEAFFGKTLIDMSKKSVMTAPGQRTGPCLVRPLLPTPTGVRAANPESKNIIIIDAVFEGCVI